MGAKTAEQVLADFLKVLESPAFKAISQSKGPQLYPVTEMVSIEEASEEAVKTVNKSLKAKEPVKCECGSDIVKISIHSTWCPKYKE
jgi:hypothetical protein